MKETQGEMDNMLRWGIDIRMDVLAVNGKRNNNSFCLFFLFMT
jgi:hypothetical protein